MSGFPEIDYGDEEPVIEMVPDALGLLRAVYSCPRLPLSVRMRAASDALPYESPKLSAVMTTSLDGDSFATKLESARQRAGLTPMKLLPPPKPAVNEKATTSEGSGPLPVVSDRRFRR